VGASTDDDHRSEVGACEQRPTRAISDGNRPARVGDERSADQDPRRVLADPKAETRPGDDRAKAAQARPRVDWSAVPRPRQPRDVGTEAHRPHAHGQVDGRARCRRSRGRESRGDVRRPSDPPGRRRLHAPAERERERLPEPGAHGELRIRGRHAPDRNSGDRHAVRQRDVGRGRFLCMGERNAEASEENGEGESPSDGGHDPNHRPGGDHSR
jgi:hypothetical protein